MPHPYVRACPSAGQPEGMEHVRIAGHGRAWVATTVVFFLTGGVFGSLASRFPAVQERLDLTPGQLAVALLGLNAGAVIGLPLGGLLVARIGARASLAAGFAVYPPATVTAAVVPGLGWLVAGLAVMAAAISVNDVAMNAEGIALERRSGRPLLSGLHAGHSFGFLGGGLLGTACAAGGVPLLAQCVGVAVVGTAGGLAATRALAPARERRRAVARPRGALLLLGLVAFCAFLVEGAANDWSAVHLRTERGGSPALAAAAFTCFTLSLALVRLAGDRLVARCGRRRAVRAAALVAAAGVTVVVVSPSAGVAMAGWGVLGAGVAVMAPTVLGAAPGDGGGGAGTAIAAVSTVGYLGSFAGPPLIGAAAELSSLSTALLVLVAAAGAMYGLAGRALPA